MDTTQHAEPSEALEVSFNRHNAFVGPADLTDTVCIIGVGATGSNLALQAAKMGFHKFIIFDNDSVEAHNLPNQAYDLQHVGLKKVDALEQVLLRFNPRIQVQKHDTYFTSEEHFSLIKDILVIAVDSMRARADITTVFDGNPKINLVIESRIGFEFGEVNIIDPMSDDEIQNWKASLRDDSEIPEGPCGRRICSTTVSMISTFMVQQMCMQKSCERRQIAWQPKKKLVLSFTDEGIITYNV